MATGTLAVGLRNMAKALFWCMISSMRTCIAVWRHFNDALLRTPTGLLITTRTPHHRSRLRATESVSTADSANCPLPRLLVGASFAELSAAWIAENSHADFLTIK